jgi:3-deoxy-manno-octulosonate cytidylyltransferase (CMP-KDO synthetase)
MSLIGIIPARFASTRFPGKPLADIKGKTMLQRVFEQASKAKKLSEVLVATDDERIAEHARALGAPVIMTSTDHPSGTDRCYEAYKLHGKDYDYVVNIQGDEPFLHPEQIDELAAGCNTIAEIVTQMMKCTDGAMLSDPGEVKIVINRRSEALYFSRQVIPFVKDAAPDSWQDYTNFYRHVGMYAYRSDVLRNITAQKPTALETAESLEQLRWLENGYRVKCIETTYESHCIDRPEDIPRVITMMGL